MPKKEKIYKPKLTVRKREFNIDRDKVAIDVCEWHSNSEKYREDWRKSYEEELKNLYNDKDDGDENFSIPLSLYHADKKHSSIHNVIFGMNKMIIAKPTSSEDVEPARKKEQWMNWELKTHMNQVDPELGISNQGDKFTHSVVAFGEANGMVTWEVIRKFGKEYRIFKLPKDLPQSFSPPEEQSSIEGSLGEQELEQYTDENIGIFFEEQMTDFFKNTITEIVAKNLYEYKVIYQEKINTNNRDLNRERTAFVEFFVDDSNVEMEVMQESITYEGARVTNIDLDDIIFSPDVVYKGIQNCQYVIRQFWQSKDDILKKIQSGEYEVTKEDKETLDNIKKGQGVGDNNQSVKELKDNLTGIESYKNIEDFQTFECFCKYDVNDDGFEEDVIFTVLADPRMTLKVKYLSEVYRHGKRPFFRAQFSVRERMGVLRMLKSIQRAIDEMYNQRMEFGYHTNNPFGFINPTSSLDPGTIKPKAGDLIPLENPQQNVYFPEFGNRGQAWASQEEITLNQYAERLMAQGDLSFARTPNKVGSLRTWGAVRDILAQAQETIKPTINRIKNGLEEMVKQIYQLNYYYMPPNLKFRVQGEDGFNFDSITREELTMMPDFEFPWNIANVDEEVRRTVAILIFQTLLNPVLIQLGIVNQEDVYNITRNLLEQHDVLDVDAYITKPQIVIPKDPNEENRMMAQGDYSEPSTADNQQEHIINHDGFVERNRAMLTENSLALFKKHDVKHYELLRQAAEKDKLIQHSTTMQNQFNAMGYGQASPGAESATRALPAPVDAGQGGGMPQGMPQIGQEQ